MNVAAHLLFGQLRSKKELGYADTVHKLVYSDYVDYRV